jgi:hypothetical protein
LVRFKGRNGTDLPNSTADVARILGASAAHVNVQSQRFETPPSDCGAYYVIKLKSGHGEFL